jgi:hypothetical protein
MSRRMWRASAPVAIALVFASASAGQTPGRVSPPAAARAPRTPWNVPDLQGRWTNATATPLQRPPELAGKEFFSGNEAAEFQKHALERALELSGLREEAAISGEFTATWMEDRPLVFTGRTSLIVGPEGRLPPFTPEGQKQSDARTAREKLELANAPEERTLAERCLQFGASGPPLLPDPAYNSNYEIVQTPTHLVIFAEMGSSTRIIPLDGRPHSGATIRSLRGESRGRWEGDTLVVETTHFSNNREFRGSTANLRLIERFRRVSADLILYEFTAEDSATWTAPWTAEIPLRPMKEAIYEFACHEGNYGLTNILKGARFVERQPK